MAKSAILAIKIITDASAAKKGMDDAASGVEKFQTHLNKAVVPAGVAAAAVVAFGKSTLDAASRAEQAMGAVESVFGKNAGQVLAWSKTSAQAVGLSSAAYNEMASVIGAQLKNLGVPIDQVAGKTNDLIKMGADLAATYGGTTAQAVEALSAALRGETDPIEKYGISIKQADIAARQAKDGTNKLTGAAAKQAKTQALLAMVTEQAGGAVGQFARETDSAAGSAQIAAAQWDNAKAAIGQALLPAAVAVAGAFGNLAGIMQQNAGVTRVLMGVVLGLAGAVLAVSGAMRVYAAGQAVASAATAFSTSTLGTWLGVKALEAAAWVASTARSVAATVALYAYSAAMTVVNVVTKLFAAASRAAWLAALGPIGLVIAAVLAVVAVVVLLWNKFPPFRNAVIAVWNAIRAAAVAVANWIRAAWSAMISALSAYVRAYMVVVSAVWNGIRAGASAVVSWLRSAWSSVWSGITSAARSAAHVLSSIWNGVRGAWSAALSGLASLFGPVTSAINAVIGAVQSLISAISRIKIPKISIPGISSASAPAGVTATGYRAAPTVAARGGVGRGGGVSVAPTIVIQGAVDPESTARQIRRILESHGTRQGLTGVLRTGLV